MKKYLLIAIIIAVIIGAALFFARKNEEAVNLVPSFKPLIKVGFIYPLSGDSAHIGHAAQTAAKLFEQDPKTKNSQYSYVTIFEDNQLNPALSVAPANKLKTTDNVDVYISINPNVGNVVSLIAEKNEVIHFALSNDDKSTHGKYNFTISTPSDKKASRLLQELKKKGLTNAALVTQDQAAMLAMSSALREQAKSYGINLISDIVITSTENDFKDQIAALSNAKPDIVIVQIPAPEILAFVKQLKTANPHIQITGIETLGYPDDKTLLEGDWFADNAAPSPAYQKAFEQINGNNATDNSESAYTALQILRDAADQVGNKKEDIIKYLTTSHEFHTALGTVKFDQDGLMQSEASLKEIKNGQPTLITQ